MVIILCGEFTRFREPLDLTEEKEGYGREKSDRWITRGIHFRVLGVERSRPLHQDSQDRER
jgi:hypothetical protein